MSVLLRIGLILVSGAGSLPAADLYCETFQDEVAGASVDETAVGNTQGRWRLYGGQAAIAEEVESDPSRFRGAEEGNRFLKIGPAADIRSNYPGTINTSRSISEFDMLSYKLRMAGNPNGGSSINISLYGGEKGGADNTIINTIVFHKTGYVHNGRDPKSVTQLNFGKWYTFEYRLESDNTYKLKIYETEQPDTVLLDNHSFPFAGSNRPNIDRHYNFRIQTGDMADNNWDVDDVVVTSAPSS